MKNSLNSKGFTLIEVLVALVILAVSLLALAGLMTTTTKNNMLIELTPNRLSVRSLHKQLTVWGIAGSPKIAYSPDSNTRSNMPENAYDLDGHDTFREERSSH